MPGKIERMRIGTPAIASFALMSVALDIWDKIDMGEVYAKSIELSELFIRAVEARCPGLKLVSPRDPAERGSHVSFAFEHGYAAKQALIAENVIGDFRAPNVMRFGITPLFLSEAEIIGATDVLAAIHKEERWMEQKFQKRSLVT